MESTDVTIEILRGIQAGIAGMRDDLADLKQHAAATNESLAKLHTDMTLTNETLGVIREPLVFAEAASSAATGARVRLDDRVDRLETRRDDLEARVEPKGS